jgi:hypothetical protein
MAHEAPLRESPLSDALCKYVSRDGNFVLWSNGTVTKIMHKFDQQGNEVIELRNAFSCIASCPHGRFASILVHCFQPNFN